MIPTYQIGQLGRQIVAASAPSNPFTWNPSDKHSSITLSNSNKTATLSLGGSWRSARSTLTLFDKQYWEILISADGANHAQIMGVGNASAALTNYCGSDANGWGYDSQPNGFKFHSGASSAYGPNGAAVGDVIGFGYRTQNGGEIYVAKNNGWLGGSDPAAGTSPMYSSVGTTGVYAMCSMFDQNSVLILRATAADFTYSPPSGFSGASA